MGDLQRILYVEDDDDIREVTEMALTLVAGFSVCACSSGAEAVKVATSFMPDMIVLDVMMPIMDGPATMASLRTERILASTPVVFLTAKVTRAAIEEYESLGVAGIIRKPFNPLTIGSQLEDIWVSTQN